MIKFVVQVKDNYDYKIYQLDLDMINRGGKTSYVIDRAAYDAHAQAQSVTNSPRTSWGNKIWKVPCQYRGGRAIDPKFVFDTREDAVSNSMKLVEEKLREDVVKKQSALQTLEREIADLSGKQLSPQGKFHNCSTLELKKGKRS